MKLRQSTLKVIEAASAAAFETAVNTFLKASIEEELVSITFEITSAATVDSTDARVLSERYVAFIVYTK